MTQSFGMTAAAFTILMMQIRVEWYSIFYTTLGGVPGTPCMHFKARGLTCLWIEKVGEYAEASFEKSDGCHAALSGLIFGIEYVFPRMPSPYPKVSWPHHVSAAHCPWGDPRAFSTVPLERANTAFACCGPPRWCSCRRGCPSPLRCTW